MLRGLWCSAVGLGYIFVEFTCVCVCVWVLFLFKSAFASMFCKDLCRMELDLGIVVATSYCPHTFPHARNLHEKIDYRVCIVI